MIGRPMPSPIGHAIAGAAVSWMAQAMAPGLRATEADLEPAHPDLTSLRQGFGDPPEQQRRRKVGPTYVRRHALTLACVAIAVLPDIDLLYMPIHRTITHSVGAVLFVFI